MPLKWLAANENEGKSDWLYEIKFDEHRALAFKDGKDVRLVSRNKKAFDYPQLVDSLKSIPTKHVILDGEIAALDEKGRASFQLISLVIAPASAFFKVIQTANDGFPDT